LMPTRMDTGELLGQGCGALGGESAWGGNGSAATIAEWGPPMT